MKQFIFLFIFIFYFSISNHIVAQVTIGNDDAPVAGALLQLKNMDNAPDLLVNSTKGLGLPRVTLTTPDKLTDILSDPTTTDEKKHTGLLVYNVNTNVHFCPGAYVWNGDQWQPLNKSRQKPDITMTDNDGNVYNAKWYGSGCQGVYWMTSNLYTTTDKSGATFTDAVRINPARVKSIDVVMINDKSDLEKVDNPLIEYQVDGVSVKDTYSAFVKKFGLLYNWDQASKACPSGWHLATVDDWDILAQVSLAVKDENDNYPSVGKHLKADNSFYKDISFTGYNAVEYNNGDCSWGGDNKQDFLGYPSGAVLKLPDTGQIGSSNFGIHAYWWTADSGVKDSSLKIDKGLHFNADALYRGENYPSYFFSVRCVKDN